MTSVSARAQQPTRRSSGIASITIYGSNASPSLSPSSINNPPPARCPLGGSDGPTLTAVVYITTRKICHQTNPFRASRSNPNPIRSASAPSATNTQATVTKQTHPQNSPSPLSYSATTARTLTKAYTNARPVASIMSAQNVAIAHTASGIAPTPVDQQQLVTLI